MPKKVDWTELPYKCLDLFTHKLSIIVNIKILSIHYFHIVNNSGNGFSVAHSSGAPPGGLKAPRFNPATSQVCILGLI